MTDERTPQPLAAILATGEARWRRHREVLDHAPGWRIRGPEDPFTPAQEYGHHAHWLEYAAAVLRAYLDGAERPAPIEDADAQNDGWAAEDAARPHEELRERAEAARADYVALVARVGREDARFLGGVESTLVGHVDQHFGYIVKGALRHESHLWERVTALLDGRPEGAVHRGERGVAWRSSDIYAHLERWMAIQVPRVERFLETGEVADLPASTDALNARWLPEDASLSFGEARRRAFLTRDRFIAQMRSIPLDRWTARLMGLYAGNSFGHYGEHLAYIAGR